MRKLKYIWTALFTGSFIYLLSCQEKPFGQSGLDRSHPDSTQTKYQVEYARRFSIESLPSGICIRVNNPWPGAQNKFCYLLMNPKNPTVTDMEEPVIPIQNPPETMVCLSTTHLPFIEMLGEENRLTGFPNTNYIYSLKINKLVKEEKVHDLGATSDINIESILNLNPGLVIAFSMGNDFGQLEKITQTGIPVILNADYLEDHPLGRAEWIKFFGLILGKYELADSLFTMIRNNYLALSQKTASLINKPSVFTGVVYGDTWFMPGGENYAARFFQDAGADYIWKDIKSSEPLQLSFESVYEKAIHADFWLGTATLDTKEAIYHTDARYAELNAFKKDQIYNYTARTNPAGGNDYFESGYARPDLILEDLVKIFHPELMPDHNLYFYRKIE